MIKHFYFSPLVLNFHINKFPSVTDKTFFRPDVLSVRNNETTGKKPLYHFQDGKYDSSLDLSALSHFPERVEVKELIDIQQNIIDNKARNDLLKHEEELKAKADENFKQTIIDSVSNNVADSSSVTSDS